MPASTGTEGRGGRLRAVQATASASTSRATRNFISRPTSPQPATVDGILPVRGARDLSFSLHCSSCLVRSSGGKPRPFPDLSGPRGAQLPHPDCCSRKLRDNSFILVITGVEAGDN